jgi:tight adherence protein C
MFKTMLWLAVFSGSLAISAALLVASRAVFNSLDQIRSAGLSAVFKSWLKRGVMRPMLTWLGRRLLPFITWNQRHGLNKLLIRSGLSDFDYTQIFASQVLLSLLALLGYWFVSSIGAPLRLATRADLLLGVLLSACVASLCWWLPILWLKQRYRQRINAIERSLPFFLDMVGLGLGSGQNLQASLQLACDHLGDGALKSEWLQTLGDIRTGTARSEALRQMSVRIESTSLRQLISALIQGESLGQGMTHIIEVYGTQQRAQRLMHAEKLALQAPVKMLFPLALFIFPCTFLVLGFPVLVQLLGLQP